MMTPAPPPHPAATLQAQEQERKRLAALRDRNLLDTPAETAFDDFTVLASRLCRAPIALVSLVDEHRQWFKSRVGIDADETPREWAFCDHAIRREGVFAVSDACADPRFAGNPLVTGDPRIRFYAGVPLVVGDGHAIGTLCIIDRQPRNLSDEDRDTLERLGRQVVHLIELRHLAARLREAELQQRQQHLERAIEHEQARALLEALPVGVLVHDRDARIVQANRAAAAILGRLPEELAGQEARAARWHTVDAAGHPLSEDAHPVARVLASGAPVPPQTLGVRITGDRQRWLRVSCAPRPGANGHPDGAITVIADQTDEHLQRQWLDLAVEAAPISPWRWRMTEDQLTVSTGWLERLGFAPERPGLPSQNLRFWPLVHREDAEQVRTSLAMHEMNARVPYRAEFRVRDGQGRWHWMLALGASTERDAEGRILSMSGIVLDVDERKRAETELQRAATTDPLTGLPNRTLLADRLTQALRTAERHGHSGAVLFIDLDHFKRINDVHGHAAGDRVLVAAGQRLAACLREEDTLARMGGDELMVLLPHVAEGSVEALAGAQKVGTRLLEALTQPFTIDGVDHIVGASIGCTVFPKTPGENAADIVREADTAMYAAKSAGRGGLRVYEAGMQQAVAESVAIERDLRRALDTDELSLHLQGKWTAEGELVGAEVLLRWQHPQRGAVSPAQFIPVAEDTGLILPLGRRVLREALEIAAAQRRAGTPLPLAVNVSPRQFRESGFADEVIALLGQTGAHPEDITLEITEGVLVDDIDDCARRMERLAALGMRFAIDDFGTGYSSLLYLKKLPIHELKIDRAFVRDIETDPEDAAIVRAMTAVARGFGIEAVAEGVETRSQAAFLIDAGCRLMQGWLFGRATSVEQFLAARDSDRQARAAPASG